MDTHIHSSYLFYPTASTLLSHSVQAGCIFGKEKGGLFFCNEESALRMRPFLLNGWALKSITHPAFALATLR